MMEFFFLLKTVLPGLSNIRIKGQNDEYALQAVKKTSKCDELHFNCYTKYTAILGVTV